MAKVFCRKDTGLLLLDFRWQGQRCREHTLLPDTPANRARLDALARRIERAIQKGTFCYADFFPDSRRAKSIPSGPKETYSTESGSAANGGTPLFSEFAETWFAESEPRWRKRYRRCMRDTLDRIFVPYFGNRHLGEITKADLLAFRAEIAKRRGHGGRTLSARRINKLMSQLKSIINEGCERSNIRSPWRDIAPLKQKRFDVRPFTLAEVELLIATVRDDYKPYLTLRCMTGLRTGEADGLQWCDIDFERNVIKVERSHFEPLAFNPVASSSHVNQSKRSGCAARQRRSEVLPASVSSILNGWRRYSVAEYALLPPSNAV